MGSSSNTRAKRAAAGLCAFCGTNPPNRGASKRCDACLAESKRYTASVRHVQKIKREQRAAAGLCTHCGLRKATHGKRCEPCRTRDNAKHQEWLAESAKSRKANGLCKDCGVATIAKRSESRCNACLTRLSARHGERQVRQNAYMREYSQRQRLQVIDHYTDGKRQCQCCGESEVAFLTIDHVNEDGALDRSIFKLAGGVKLYRRIIKAGFPADFQILCWNCNCGKHRNGGVCPHKQKEAT